MAYTTINKSTDYFNTKLWTGTGANLSITGVGHQPDFTWIKNRANTDDHNLFDVLRGFSTDALLRSNTSGAATDTTEGIKSFDSDGFSLGTNGSSNGNGQGMVSWNWKAGTTGSGNTGGSGTYKTYSYSVNTTAGFSIIKYIGNGSSGHTIPHHLGAVPKWILVKNFDSTGGWAWRVYHTSLGATKRGFLDVNTEPGTDSTAWNDVEPTSTVFTVGNSTGTNSNNENFIAYCFAEKTGYSKFGAVSGNGNANGPFIYTGFAPSFVLYRKTNGAGDWYFVDNKRPGYNDINKRLYANTNQAEESYNLINLYSNGFKLTDTTHTYTNDGSGVYMYMAFGQSLVGTNNVPCTAR